MAHRPKRLRTTRGGRRRVTALAGIVVPLAVVAAACLPGQVFEVRDRDESWGYPGFGIDVTQACRYRLDATQAGWAALMAINAEPGADLEISDAALTGLPPGPRQWRSPVDQSVITSTPQSYELWDGAGLGEQLAARIEPGESFGVRYRVAPRRGGRHLPAGDENVGVRVLDDAGEPLTLVEDGCTATTVTPAVGLPPTIGEIDWLAATAAQDTALAAGLVLPLAWTDEWLRSLDVCGYVDVNTPPQAPFEGVTMLTADHGTGTTVGVLGDSMTSQIRDELAADSRFDWVIGSLCAARIDHFLGAPVLPDLGDLSFAVDEVLAADPDVVVVALGMPETVHLPGGDHTASITALRDRLDDVPCVLWMNLHVSERGATWEADATQFNSDVAALGGPRGIVRLDWDAAAAAVGSGQNHPWLLPGPFDLFHVSNLTGHQARVGMTLAGIDACLSTAT